MENKDFQKSIESTTVGLEGMMEFLFKNLEKTGMNAAQKKDFIRAKKEVDIKLDELRRETEKLSKIKI